MTLLRQYRIASSLLILLSIVAFSIAELDFAMLIAGVVLAVVSWYVTEGPRGRTLPAWATNTLTVGLVAYCAGDFLLRGDLESAMGSLGRFLLWLLVIKLYARRTETEDRQRFTLATMIMLTGCLESVELLFGLLVIAFAMLAAWTAMLWRLAKGAERARLARAAEPGFAPPLEIAFGRRATPHLHWLAASAVVLIFATSLLGFFLFPRLGHMRFGEAGMGAITGFSELIDLRGGERINESRREIFTVQYLDQSGEPVQAARPLLLRGAVLDAYDARAQRWYARRMTSPLNTYRTMDDGRMMDFTRGVSADTRGRARVRFEMRSSIGDLMFSMYAPVGIATSDPRLVGIDRNSLLLRDISTERSGRSWRYELLVQPNPDAATLRELCAGARPPDSSVGFPVGEIRPIAEQIVADLARTGGIPPELGEGATEAERWTRNREVARAIASWMKTQFTYTTDLSAFGRIPGEDPIVSFLTRYKSGHCEYFASGLCAVLRSLGIDSRIVTGFIAMEYDQQAQCYVVRESNAHAWTEVRTGELAWTAIDATPEDSLFEIQERNRSFADRFRWIYSKLEFLWNSSVVSYDATSQKSFASSVESGWREAISKRLEAALGELRALTTVLSLGRAGTFWFATIGICFGAALLAWVIVVVRQRRLRVALHIERLPAREQVRLGRDAAFYAEALRALADAGVEKPEHLSPRAFADSLSARSPEVGRLFAQIAEAFYKVRYGGIQPSRAEANAHLSSVSALRDALRANSRSLRVD